MSDKSHVRRLESAPSTGVARGAWIAAGLVLVGLGGLGAVLPVLPTTVFFIGAAACFARSSPRLERWVLELPHVGPMVRDYRSGLGMPRRAKITASTAIAVAVGLSAAALASWPGRGAAVALGLVGIGYVTLRVPTRERVLAGLADASGSVVPVTVLGRPDLAGRGRPGRSTTASPAAPRDSEHRHYRAGEEEERDQAA
jgi:uncharacterized membrane protein YbaN (DUF454 family)